MKPDLLKSVEPANRLEAAMLAALALEAGAPTQGDARWMRWLLTIKEWSPEQRREAWVRLSRYRIPLERAGVRWLSIPEPAPTEERVVATEDKRIGLNGRGFYLRFPRNEEDAMAVREIAGARWRKEARAWWVPYSAATAAQVLGLTARRGFVLDDAAAEQLAELRREDAQRVAESRAAADSLEVEGLGLTPRPYQRAGVRYLCEQKKAFLADEMGLGKTGQALMAVQALGAWPCVVVCPAAVKLGWEREARRWLPGVAVEVWPEKRGTGSGERVLRVVNYEHLKKHGAALREGGIGSVIVDEIQFVKNGKAQRTKALRELVARVPVRFGLSGTPIENRHSELLAECQVLGILDKLGGFWTFAERYCGGKPGKFGWDFSGNTNPVELNRRLREVGYLRRLKREVLTELPPKQRVLVPLDLENRAEYDRAAADVKAWLAEKTGWTAATEAALAGKTPAEQEAARLLHFEAALEKLDGMEQLLRFEALKQLAARGKLTGATAWAETFLESGRKLVLFAYHREIVDALRDGLATWGAEKIDGGMPLPRRQKAIARFQQDPDCRVLVLNLLAGGVGIDGLQYATSYAGFLEFGWTPPSMDQAEDRLHRGGQTEPVTIYQLGARETVDTEIAAMLAAKRAVLVAAAGDDETVPAAAAREDSVRRLARSFFQA